MKTLTEQYNLIKNKKGNKSVFLKEAKRLFPNLLTNSSNFKEASTILKQKNIISENFVGIGPINNPFEVKKKEGYETALNILQKKMGDSAESHQIIRAGAGKAEFADWYATESDRVGVIQKGMGERNAKNVEKYLRAELAMFGIPKRLNKNQQKSNIQNFWKLLKSMKLKEIL